ncbi:MAG TPA: hypothetical protein VL503_06355 [Candidatus Omnitrophota bacterium]|nr:hypothetical protein [Candidatus Omnitrophota bacterium]
MHPIRAAALAALAALVLAAPSLSPAHGDSHASQHGYAYGNDRDDFTWAVVDGGNTSMSGQVDHPTLDQLKDRFGERFLYIEDDEDGYVIIDRAMVERAHRATERIGRYGREIGEIARTQAKLSLSEARPKIRRAELLREQAELRREIDRAERQGEPTDRLERRLDRVTTRLEVEDQVYGGFALSSDEKQDLTRRRDEAKARLHEAVEQVNREMRDILRDAKERRIAEPVD